MENQDKKEAFDSRINKQGSKMHHILSFSYTFFLLMFLISLALDFIFPIKIFKNNLFIFLGFVFIILATLIILWAQKTSRNLKVENLTEKNFLKGPYVLSRSPTHWGLFLLIFGFGFTINAFFTVIFSVLSIVFSKIFFLRKGESFLEKKYGEPYRNYKKIVKF